MVDELGRVVLTYTYNDYNDFEYKIDEDDVEDAVGVRIEYLMRLSEEDPEEYEDLMEMLHHIFEPEAMRAAKEEGTKVGL